MKTTKQKGLAKTTPLMFFLSLSVLTACISACGQKGALYLPQDNINNSTVVIDDSAVTKNTALKNIDE
ncbi:MAG: lipoprotein [Pseudomonadales bacterium]|nr:lipoprotein [Pseudomonadales bacterium]